MEPGTGKTRAALELARSVEGCDYYLWLTPFQTKKNLKEEIEKWSESKIDIVGIESLSNSDRLYLELISLLKKAINPFIIVDESLKIKNWDAKRTRRIVELGTLAKYKLILNGTPLSRNLLDLWAQMEFLSPKILQCNMTEYKNTFCEYVRITKKTGNRSLVKEFITGYHNVDVLYELIEPYVFEADLDLKPKKVNINLPYRLTAEEMREHDEIKKKYLDDERMEMRNNNIFLEITTLLQHNYSCSPEKFEVVNKLLKENDRKKVLIYARYIDTQEELKRKFPDVMVLSWQKHAFGLNLQQYNRIIFFDKVWDYALRDQAEHRVYRVGQEDDCLFYDLTGNVGLEDLMNNNIARKGDLLKYFKKKSVEELRRVL